ncbi:MAG TPA: hypothetical protein VIM48_07040 [Chthoniobacterales bacterium]
MNIEQPICDAWKRTRGWLFQPFVFTDWLRLGFVAWLASFLTGSSIPSFNFSIPHSGGTGPDGGASLHWIESLGFQGIVLVVCGIILIGGLLLVLLFWIGARAQFMFLDNVVRQRVAVREPWQEFREQGNRFFGFYAWVASVPLLVMVLILLAALVAFWPDLMASQWPAWQRFLPWFGAMIMTMLFGIVWSVGLLLYRDFGVPILYVENCTATEAAWRIWGIVRTSPGRCFLYLVVRIALALALGMLAGALVLATCCIGSLPYVGMVLTLPLWVFRQSFVLDCLSQLAPEYRLWRDEPPPLDQPAMPTPE